MFTHNYRDDDDPTNPHRKPQTELEIEAVASGWKLCNGSALQGRQYVDCNGWISPTTGSCGSLAPFKDRIALRTILLEHQPVKLDVEEESFPWLSFVLDCSCGNHIDWSKAILSNPSDPTSEKAWADHVVGVILNAGLTLERG